MRISVINDDAATEVISPLGYISVFPFHCVFFSLILIMSRFLFFTIRNENAFWNSG